MTDRELLELAAKAAGIKWLPATTEKGIELEPKFGLWLVTNGEQSEYQRRRWNPLTDDGDALRLAVMLDIDVAPNIVGQANAGDAWEFHCENNNDKYAATRRAIVRAAAEIGMAMSERIA